jgi:hypothetical protein
VRTLLLLLLAGCGNLSQQRHLVTTVPRLRPAAASVINQGDVIVSVDPLTSMNWRTYPEVTAKVSILVHDTSQAAVEGGGTGVSLRWEDMLLMPLPAFRLHVTNQSQGKLSFAHAHARLGDDAQTVEAMDPGRVRARIDTDVLARRNRQNGSISDDQMTNIRAVVDALPLLKAETEIAPQSDWHGYAAFSFESDQPITHLVFVLEGVTLDGKPLEPFRVPFVVERRHASRACKDGSPATPLGVCPGDEQELVPAMDGPCIQGTRVPNSLTARQWWIGGEPVANSDLHSTLMSHPDSRAAIRRGLYFRGFGYALIGGGLILAATASVGITQAVGSKYGPAGLAFAVVPIIGGGLAWAGTRRTDTAIRAYNEQAEAGGVCQVVY